MSVARGSKRLRRESLGFSRLVCLVGAVILTCYVLYKDDVLPSCSINTVWEAINRLAKAPHAALVTVGLLPVYVALMVFGAAFIGAFVGYGVRAVFRRLNS